MRGPGAIISFYIKGGLNESSKMLKNCTIFTCAESLGAVESLIEHPAIMTHASIPLKTRENLGISDNLVRVSVGIENFQDLRDDLNEALSI